MTSGNKVPQYVVVRHVVARIVCGSITTAQGLIIHAEFDASSYPKGQTISDDVFKNVQLKPDPFHGEWNYSITPHATG